MATPQYVYHMSKVSKTYPGGKQVLKDISLSFLPCAKIGVVGSNGSGKSSLLKIMAGLDKDFQGEAWAAEGAKVGYLPQEPELDPGKDVRLTRTLRRRSAPSPLLRSLRPRGRGIRASRFRCAPDRPAHR